MGDALTVEQDVALPGALRMVEDSLEGLVDTDLRASVVEHRDGGVVEFLEQITDGVSLVLREIATLLLVVVVPVVGQFSGRHRSVGVEGVPVGGSDVDGTTVDVGGGVVDRDPLTLLDLLFSFE